MKKKSIYLLLAASCYTVFAEAQSMNGPPVAPRDVSAYTNLVNINGQDGFYMKKDLYAISSYTIIDGQRVLGFPFLYYEWQTGSITTPDGRVYTDYGIKYNVQNQTISFKSGKDSLEANEEIKEFTLNVPLNDTLLSSTKFVNANQYQRSNQALYYEIVLEDEKGQLLRTNQKVVATDALDLASKSQKYLKLERNYLYFDKQKKKLYKIKPATNVRTMLNLTDEQETAMQLKQYDLSKEEDIIAMMRAYQEKTRLKAF